MAGNEVVVQRGGIPGSPSTASMNTAIQNFLNGSPIVDQGIKTTNIPAVRYDSTWNNAAVAFRTVVVNVTYTANANGSTFYEANMGAVKVFEAGVSSAGGPRVIIRHRTNAAIQGGMELNASNELQLFSKPRIGNWDGTTFTPYVYFDMWTSALPAIGVGGQSGSTWAGIAINRNMFDGQTGSGHGFVVTDLFRRGGLSAYAAFDSIVVMQGFDYDHCVAFQGRNSCQFSSSGQAMLNYYNLTGSVFVDTGKLTNCYIGSYSFAPILTNGGRIDNSIGHYVEQLAGTLTAFAYYSAGTTPSYFGGAVNMGSLVPTGAVLPIGGGATSAFPALKRVGAALHCRLGDDSNYAGLQCGRLAAFTSNLECYQGTGSVSGSGTTPFFSQGGTWNTTGNVVGFLFNVTNTASGVTSLLFDWQLSTVSILKVSKLGFLTLSGVANPTAVLDSSGTGIPRLSLRLTTAERGYLNVDGGGSGLMTLGSTFALNIQSGGATAIALDTSQHAVFAGTIKAKDYTVATLPNAPAPGAEANVTDAAASPVWGATPTGGGGGPASVGVRKVGAAGAGGWVYC